MKKIKNWFTEEYKTSRLGLLIIIICGSAFSTLYKHYVIDERQQETVMPFYVSQAIKCGEQYQIVVQLDSEREPLDHNTFDYSNRIFTEEAGWRHIVPLKGDLSEMRWYKIMCIREDLATPDTAITIGRFNIN